MFDDSLEKKKARDKELHKLSVRINAINSPLRLALLGYLYMYGKKNFKQLMIETKEDDNKLAYHLNVMLDVGFIKKIKGYYSLTSEGKKWVKTQEGFVKGIKNL